MLITFTPSGGALATLADDPNKLFEDVEPFGLRSVVQTAQVYKGANEVDFPKGNAGGQFVFTSGKSYATPDAAAAAVKTEFGRVNQQGSLVATIGATTWTFANAVLFNVESVDLEGRWLKLRYHFKISTIA